ncbi:hypothetical protein GCK72_022832 [Caenorhabditis remanei]|uniref:Uncharacterized protein n=1 Tax=Caenorhabditis remanei TaxID=31234 RepID=A0A6A5FUS1_CAERE|nr:hypothetical protein GCK72_022832 [Caenorhabditis remanei]KAF1746378.1 hypothetical protein GCK72_022832 [Caenorhabditis remanei]
MKLTLVFLAVIFAIITVHEGESFPYQNHQLRNEPSSTIPPTTEVISTMTTADIPTTTSDQENVDKWVKALCIYSLILVIAAFIILLKSMTVSGRRR